MSLSPTSDRAEMNRVSYDTASFDTVADRLQKDVEDDRPRCVVFLNGSAERRQTALGTLSSEAPSVHQFRLPSLLSDQRMQTQNALRKAFDHAAEEGAVLFFDRVDAIFEHVHADVSDVEGEAEPTTAEYFFDRVRAYTAAPVVLGIQDPASIHRTDTLENRIIVDFE